MLQDITASGSIEVNAGPGKVWQALTDPEIIREYLFGTQTITDWKVGNDIIFQGEYGGHPYRDKGTILENVPNELISYSYWSGFSGLEDKPENYARVTYRLTPAGDHKTLLTWMQQGFADRQGYEHAQSGMQAFLGGIKHIIER